MHIPFTPNAHATLGIEMELHVVDPVSGDLVNAAVQVLREAGRGHPDGVHPKAKHELFQSTIEIITDVCRTPAEAAADLRATLAEVARAATAHGVALMSAGTHPFSLARDQLVSPNPRYEMLIEEMQWAARRLLICGTHVHVGVPSGEHAIAAVNELQRHLPLFLILSSSSPFLEGESTGLASTRSKVFEALPTAGLPPVLHDWSDFEMFMDTLLAAECITSVREVWWDVRPHPDFGTVELRVCDAVPTIREAAAIAALAQAVVARTIQQYDDGTLAPPPREWSVRENQWLAARHGVEAQLIVDDLGTRRPAGELVDELLVEMAPVAARLGSSASLEDVRALWALGPGYLRQQRIVARGGSLRDVVHDLRHQLAADEPA